MNKSVFQAVNYRQFRSFLADVSDSKIKGKGYETVICDKAGNVQAIMHAASIDEHGRCHPAEYFVRNQHPLSLAWAA